MKFKTIADVGRQTFQEFSEDKVLRLSASLAYYAIFSIGPLLFILLILSGFVFGESAVRHQLHGQLSDVVGEKSAETVESMMIAPKASQNLATTILGIITLVFGATGVFGQLQDALNTIWEVEAKPGQGIWGFIRQRFLSASMVLGLGFLLLISMVITTAVEAMASNVGRAFPLSDLLIAILSGVASFIVVALFFALLFKFLPDVKVPWRAIWVGAIVTAILFTIGKYGLSLYLGRQATASSYGAAGSVVVLLLWIFYSSVILFLGAEFTQVYARYAGAHVRPAQYAVSVTEQARAEEGIPHEGIFGETSLEQSQGAAVGQTRDKTGLALIFGAGILAGWWLGNDQKSKSKA